MLWGMTWRPYFSRSLPLLLLLALAGCSSEDSSTGAPELFDGSADATDGADADAAELRAGYSRVALPWRVGAKPGQVGTAEADSYLQFLSAGVSEILPILQRTEPDPTPIIREITAWVLQKIEEQVNATMPGTYARIFQPGRGIELPPDVKALVVERGGEKVALVRADLYIMHEQLQRRVAELVEERTGIGRDRLFLVATHNHSVPHSVSPAAGVWILADAFDPRQFVYVAERIAQAIIEANDRLEPAELRVSRQEFRDVQRNVIGPGSSMLENPDGVVETVEVGYPRDYIDPDLMMLRFDRPNGGDSIASLFLFGMHPESLTPEHGI